ncbi:MAG TPA: LPS export ABC transporter permease LptG [Beijerinckiaceae bacterium]|nr:LPS export ABC transporter permease LptG [Beijerinckiaceae bacterium]
MIGATLGAYLLARFARTILAVFGAIFALIALVDFVEMFRRAAGIPQAGAGTIALLSMMRTPAISEQVLPFAVLGGSMFTFVALSRKLELVVARAAGVSVWQFLGPPLLVVLSIGIFSVAAFNPVAALLKQRADQIETSLFGGVQRAGSDSSLWIHQSSVDGQAIIRAEHSSDKGTVLANVSVFGFDQEDRFQERIDAARAHLLQGFWRLKDARVIAPGEKPHAFGVYLLATNLTPAQVTQSFVAPESVPFWDLPNVVRRTEQAGLDATAYRLRYQTLLARPLLLVAMVLIAACFSLRFFRFGGVSRTVAGGVISGFVLYVATKLVADLGGAGLLSAPVAAWSPAVVASMLGTLVLLNQEDG